MTYHPSESQILRLVYNAIREALRVSISNGNFEADVIETNGNKGLVTISPGHISTDNSTETPLDIDGVFTGQWEDITNFGVIVTTVKSDQESATDGLKIEFSCDGTNVISDDKYTIPANKGKTFSFQAAAKYYRVVYTNSGIAQTSFCLHTVLKPYYVKPSSHRIADSIIDDDDAELVKAVLSGENPSGDYVNFQSTQHGNFKVSLEEIENNVSVNSNTQLKVTNFTEDGNEGLSLYDDEVGSRSQVGPLNELKTFETTRLVGTVYEGSTKDPNFWTETVTGTGSVAQDGKITLCTGTTANSTAKYCSVRKARKITGSTNEFRCIAAITTEAQADNIRRIGYYDANDGYFFQLNGTTFQVVIRKSTVDTAVSNGSFNGNYGASFTPAINTLYRLVIQQTAGAIRFFINGILVHKTLNTITGLTTRSDLPVCMDNINSNGNTTDNCFLVYFATVVRLGKLSSESTYKYISANGTNVLKYGAGRLLKINILDNAGTITIYDNIAASGTLIGVIDAGKVVGTINFECPFNNGLTIVTATNAICTVIYE